MADSASPCMAMAPAAARMMDASRTWPGGARPSEESRMSKGMERKKETKKKAAKSLEEKRAIKQAKRAERKR